MGLVPISFFHQDASTDVQHDLSGSLRDLNLRSNFDINFFRSICICFDASQQEEHDGVQIISLALLIQKLLKKKLFLSKRSILTYMTSVASWLKTGHF